jgi:hypothetical protein
MQLLISGGILHMRYRKLLFLITPLKARKRILAEPLLASGAGKMNWS